MFQEGWGGGRRRKVWESPWGFLKCPRGQSVSRRRVSRGPRGTAARVVIGPRVMEQGTGCHWPQCLAWGGGICSVVLPSPQCHQWESSDGDRNPRLILLSFLLWGLPSYPHLLPPGPGSWWCHGAGGRGGSPCQTQVSPRVSPRPSLAPQSISRVFQLIPLLSLRPPQAAASLPGPRAPSWSPQSYGAHAPISQLPWQQPQPAGCSPSLSHL